MEYSHSIHDVPGKMEIRRTPGSTTHAFRQWTSERRQDPEDLGQGYRVVIHFDDRHGNGHDTFTVCADSFHLAGGVWRFDGLIGAAHDDIVRMFPELSHLVKWHLCSTNGPMHYIADTLFLAGDKDPEGLAKGEPSRFETVVYFGNSPVPHRISEKMAEFAQANAGDAAAFKPVEVTHRSNGRDYGSHYFPAAWPYGTQWHECPWKDLREATDFANAFSTCGFRIDRQAVAWSEGKERELDAARRAACWPDATDEQLCLPKDELAKLLQDRLPALIQQFRDDTEAAGFEWVTP